MIVDSDLKLDLDIHDIPSESVRFFIYLPPLPPHLTTQKPHRINNMVVDEIFHAAILRAYAKVSAGFAEVLSVIV